MIEKCCGITLSGEECAKVVKDYPFCVTHMPEQPTLEAVLATIYRKAHAA